MDAPRYSPPCAALGDVLDPRRRRGRRYPWPEPLTLIAAALVGGAQGVRAVGQWAAEHAEELIPQLALPGRVPGAATRRRAPRTVAAAALEERPARFAADLPAPARPPATAPTWTGLAADGKAVRGGHPPRRPRPPGRPGPPRRRAGSRPGRGGRRDERDRRRPASLGGAASRRGSGGDGCPTGPTGAG